MPADIGLRRALVSLGNELRQRGVHRICVGEEDGVAGVVDREPVGLRDGFGDFFAGSEGQYVIEFSVRDEGGSFQRRGGGELILPRECHDGSTEVALIAFHFPVAEEVGFGGREGSEEAGFLDYVARDEAGTVKREDPGERGGPAFPDREVFAVCESADERKSAEFDAGARGEMEADSTAHGTAANNHAPGAFVESACDDVIFDVAGEMAETLFAGCRVVGHLEKMETGNRAEGQLAEEAPAIHAQARDHYECRGVGIGAGVFGVRRDERFEREAVGRVDGFEFKKGFVEIGKRGE